MDFYVCLTLCFISHSSVRFPRVLILSIFVFVSFSSLPRWLICDCVFIRSFVFFFFCSIPLFFPGIFVLDLAAYLLSIVIFTGEYEAQQKQQQNSMIMYTLIMGISADDDAQLKMQKAENRIDFILEFRSKYDFNT